MLFVLVSCTASLQESCDLDTVCACFMYCITGRIEKSLWVEQWIHDLSSIIHQGDIWDISADITGKSVKHQVAPCNKFIKCAYAALSRRKNATNYSTKYKPEIV